MEAILYNSLCLPPTQTARAFLQGQANSAGYRDQDECQRKLGYPKGSLLMQVWLRHSCHPRLALWGHSCFCLALGCGVRRAARSRQVRERSAPALCCLCMQPCNICACGQLCKATAQTQSPKCFSQALIKISLRRIWEFLILYPCLYLLLEDLVPLRFVLQVLCKSLLSFLCTGGGERSFQELPVVLMCSQNWEPLLQSACQTTYHPIYSLSFPTKNPNPVLPHLCIYGFILPT